MCERVKRLDVFFHQNVLLTYNKSFYIRTVAGATATILLVMGLITFAGQNYLSVWNEDIISLTNYERKVPIDVGMNPGSMGFEIAFGLNERDLDPRIGEWSMHYIQWGWAKNGTLKRKKKVKSNLFPCNNMSGNWEKNTNLNHKLCTDAFNNTI